MLKNELERHMACHGVLSLQPGSCLSAAVDKFMSTRPLEHRALPRLQ